MKNEIKGITIIVLVITIIILLILTGIAINFGLEENGIFRRAQNASKVYTNAKKNEEIELQKVSNYIDNILKENEEDNEILEVEKAIEEGIIYKSNTTIYDEYKNPIEVPKGFKLANDSGKTVFDGIVIEDVEAGDDYTRGNQYVWIPIGDIKIDKNGTKVSIELGRYEFYTDIKGVIKQSADEYKKEVAIELGEPVKFVEKTSGGTNVLAKDLGEFIRRSKDAGGYYLGRYEAGRVEGINDKFHIKKGKVSYNTTQSNAAMLTRSLYSENENIQSDLVNSYAWDTAIVFIQAFSGDPDYSNQGPLQTTLATTGDAHDSNGNYDVRCNIYDMAGNLKEWCTESTDNDIDICVNRGGYFATGDHVCWRWGNHIDYGGPDMGFRSILYVL